MSVECPECDFAGKNGTSFAAHWGMMHDGEPPDDIDTSRDPEAVRKSNEKMRGRPLSEDHKQSLHQSESGGALSGGSLEKMRESMKGKEFTKEHREKISDALQGNEHTVGFTHDDSARQKISDANSGSDHWNWKGGVSKSGTDRGQGWQSTASEVRERDNHRCQFCGLPPYRMSSLHVHHVDPARNGGSHDKSNLISLCVYCHANIECSNWYE